MVNAYDIERLLDQAAAARQEGDKRRTADLYRQAAELLHEAGDADNAIRTFFSAAALESEGGEPARAETTLRRALTLCASPETAYLEPQILFHLARALLAQGRKAEAIDLFKRIIPLEKQFDAVLYAPEARSALEELGVKPPP